MVLILVLWISTGLGMVALLFGYSMMMEYRMGENTLAGMQSEQAMEGVIRYLSHTLKNLDTPGSLPDETQVLAEGVQLGSTYYWLIGRDPNNTNSDRLTIPVFRIMDECAKVNINSASAEMLESLPGMTPQIAAAIIDWRDSDSSTSENGAESDYYQLLTPGYQCKNANFETLLELRLLRDVDYEVLYGEDMNLNGILDDNENDGNETPPFDNQDGVLDKGLLEYLTIYSQIPNTASDDSELLNVNEAEDEELEELLMETLDMDRVEEIMDRLGQSSDYNSVLEFFQRSGMTVEEFAKIENRITISEEESFTGLININTAPVEVLRCIPGIDESEAHRLVTRRNSNPDNTTSTAWITEILDEESVTQASPYITGRSYQFCVDIVAVNIKGNGYRRAQYILDTSGEEPRVLHRRDLGNLGWALGQPVYQQFTIQQEMVR